MKPIQIFYCIFISTFFSFNAVAAGTVSANQSLIRLKDISSSADFEVSFQSGGLQSSGWTVIEPSDNNFFTFNSDFIDFSGSYYHDFTIRLQWNPITPDVPAIGVSSLSLEFPILLRSFFPINIVLPTNYFWQATDLNFRRLANSFQEPLPFATAVNACLMHLHLRNRMFPLDSDFALETLLLCVEGINAVTRYFTGNFATEPSFVVGFPAFIRDSLQEPLPPEYKEIIEVLIARTEGAILNDIAFIRDIISVSEEYCQSWIGAINYWHSIIEKNPRVTQFFGRQIETLREVEAELEKIGCI
jgi:hypothetical protein